MIGKEGIIQIDAVRFNGKYSDAFLYTDILEEASHELVRKLAGKALENPADEQAQ